MKSSLFDWRASNSSSNCERFRNRDHTNRIYFNRWWFCVNGSGNEWHNTASNAKDRRAIIAHALAGQYLGKKMIYLEAGSGAKYPVENNIIKAVKDVIDIPLIIGGGLSSPEIVNEKGNCWCFSNCYRNNN